MAHSPTPLSWLIAPDGARRRIDGRGLMVGRGHDCDVLLEVPTASRHHALVRLGKTGPTVVPLSGRSVDINGRTVDEPAALDDGTSLRVAGVTFLVKQGGSPSVGSPDWAVRVGTGVHHAIHPAGLRIGGGARDDLHVPLWPSGALRLLPHGPLLLAEVDRPLSLNGRQLLPGWCVELLDGACFEPAEPDQRDPLTNSLRVRRLEARILAPTAPESAGRGVTSLRLAFRPRGGRLTLRMDGVEHSLDLPERSFDLVAALVQNPGEYLDDDTLCARIWGREETGRARQRINLLLHRTRRAFVGAGLPGPKLLERAPGGGGTRIKLAARATVDVV